MFWVRLASMGILGMGMGIGIGMGISAILG